MLLYNFNKFNHTLFWGLWALRVDYLGLHNATMMAGYSILGTYPMEVMHSFKLIRTWNRFTYPLVMSGLRIGPHLMDGLSAGRSPPRRKRKGKGRT